MILIKTHNSPQHGTTRCTATVRSCIYIEGDNSNGSHMLLSKEDYTELQELTVSRENGGPFGEGPTEDEKVREKDIRTRGVEDFNRENFNA